MALATFLAELQGEASCPVCLKPLRDPVTLDCGHNCCGPCLQQRWAGLLDVLPCPVCQHHCPSRDVRRNPLLGALADLLRQLPPTSDQKKRQNDEEETLCAQHQQALDLFCEEDLELLCAQCRVSSPHRSHPLVPVEQAAAHHREKLKSYLEPLRRQLKKAERGFALQVSRTRELREKAEAQRNELDFKFAQFKHFLEKGKDVVDNRVLREMSDVFQAVSESRNQMSEYGRSLRSLLSDVTTLCVQTDLELLRGVESVHRQWYMCVSQEVPAAYSWKLLKERFILAPHSLSLETIISKFQADLTLDPETAHHSLVISEDGKSAIFSGGMVGPDSVPRPWSFTSHKAVLGTEGFQTGRHFWQVDIRGSGVWSLGVCKESFPRNGQMPPSPSNGCWCLQQSTELNLDHCRAQIRVGVFLDYELGVISFYSLESRLYLCSLMDTFTEKLFPYFSAGPSFSMILFKDEC